MKKAAGWGRPPGGSWSGVRPRGEGRWPSILQQKKKPLAGKRLTPHTLWTPFEFPSQKEVDRGGPGASSRDWLASSKLLARGGGVESAL